MPKRTCISALPNGRFTISDIPEESPASFTPISPELSQEELRDELIRREVSGDDADKLIERAKNKGIEIF